MSHRPGSTRTHVVLAVPMALLALVLAGCGSGGSAAPKESPTAVLAKAKAALDDTAGVHLTLATDDLPDGVTGIVKADGTGTHAPAFQGTISVSLSGSTFEVPVVAVGGKVYAELPLTTHYNDIDPSDYGAPDPAALMSTTTGFSSLLPATTGLAQGDTVRGGTDNKEVLTDYAGTVPGSAVKHVIPTATGSFAVTYEVTSDDQLRELTLKGDFYGATAGSNTYTIGFDSYGTGKDITAP